MSVYIVLGLLILRSVEIFAISDDMKQMAKVLHDACVEETGVDEKFIEMCREGNFPDDPKLKCYMKCLLNKVPIMTEDGEIDVETVISLIPEEYLKIAEPIVRGCGTVKGADDCDTAYLTNKCWFSKGPEIRNEENEIQGITIFHSSVEFASECFKNKSLTFN